MPSKNLGKIITDIHYLKDKNIIYFSSEKMEISKSAPTEMPLYIGKTITQKDIKKLQRISKEEKDLNYAYSLLARSNYSTKKFMDKLSRHGIDEKSIDAIVCKIKESGFLNDSEFAKEKFDYYNDVKRFGKTNILNKLYLDQFNQSIIDSLSFSFKNELIKAQYHLNLLDKKYRRHNYQSKKQHIFTSLKRLGFTNEVICSAIGKMSPPTTKDVEDAFDADYQKALLRLKRKYKGVELQRKMRESLLRKGYQYSMIKEWEK
ncbi:MAG: RecX family transcriptional regulator [Bacilli bacterium]